MAHADTVFDVASAEWKRIPQADAYPASCGEETKAFIRYWFDVPNRRQLRALADAIGNVRHTSTRSILWCAFSRLIIAKARGASLAMDLSHSRPHKVIDKPPFRPLPDFQRAVRTVIEYSPFAVRNPDLPKVSVRQGDARCLPLEDSSIDIVITSPPYLNAIDYMRCSKFSLVWMGYEIPALRGLRSHNIGTEVSTGAGLDEAADKDVLQSGGKIDQLPARDQRMLARYIKDMDAVLREIGRVLVAGGRCVLVIGDCTMRGVYVRNSEMLKRLAHRYALSTHRRSARKLPANRRYLPPPCSKQAGSLLKARMRKEIVLTFVKNRA